MLKPGERLDELHKNGLKIIQDPAKFCFGMDAALLANFAVAHRGQRHMDLCTGNGVIPLLLTAKSHGASFAGIEIQEEMAQMANRTVQYNNLQDKVSIIHGDIKELKGGQYDVITANPPYMPVGAGEQSPTGANAIARHEICCTLDDVVACASRNLVSRGRFYMVHRPARLAEIFASMQAYKLAPKIVRLVQSRQNTPPNLVLIMATKSGNPGIEMPVPLVIYKDDGSYSDEVRRIYEDEKV